MAWIWFIYVNSIVYVHIDGSSIDHRLTYILSRRGTRNNTPLLASHDKQESRKSRDGQRFRSAAEASFQLDGVSGGEPASQPASQRAAPAAGWPRRASQSCTLLDSLMERCRSNCPRVIFCNRKQFRSATCVSTGTDLPMPAAAAVVLVVSQPGSSRSSPYVFYFQKYVPCIFSLLQTYKCIKYNCGIRSFITHK